MQKIIDLVHSGRTQEWSSRSREAFDGLFGSGGGRYEKIASNHVQQRTPDMRGDDSVLFSALIPPNSPASGAYGGMSFVLFPVEEGPALVAMVVGTQGLSPDEEVLARPGHGRKVRAICNWLNHQYGKGSMVAWAKQDPVRVDIDTPEYVQREFSAYSQVFKRYGRVLYGIFRPTPDLPEATRRATGAFLDLLFSERGFGPLSSFDEDSKRIKNDYMGHMMRDISANDVASLLEERRFAVIQGPPGTGKTRMALSLLNDQYGKRGRVIQFHPNSTYETFVGGLAPVTAAGGLGFQFAPRQGILMESAAAAARSPEPYLLVIDEINRADLAKVMGEAIYLLEPKAQDRPAIQLPYDFGEPFGNGLMLPDNLHILGTMNTADRSIAILDVAIRRRFAFVDLWPRIDVVNRLGGPTMRDAFERLWDIFVEHASDEALNLMPGHSYFLEKEEAKAGQLLAAYLQPLLQEYLSQGYVAGFAEHVRAFQQWMDALPK